MLSLTSLRKIDPSNANNLTDDELEEVRASLYELGQLIFEDWQQQPEASSKFPVWLLTDTTEKHTL